VYVSQLTQLPGIIVSSLPTGCLYALIGVGLVVVYRSTRVLNFAQGQFSLLGGHLAYMLAGLLGVNILVAVAPAAALGAVLGALIYLFILAPLTGQGQFLLVMVTIAAAIIVEAVVGLFWGAQGYFLNAGLSSTPYNLPDGIVLSEQSLVIIGATVVIIGAFSLFIRYTRLGVAMRASAENPLLASQFGVSFTTISVVSWGFTMVVAVVTGVAYGLEAKLDTSIIALSYSAFPAVLIGGLDSVMGVLIGALIVAVLQGAVATWIGGDYTVAVGFLVVFVVMLFKPNGLFGSREVARV
jgi:branched-chain amino acid transport system permease protein